MSDLPFPIAAGPGMHFRPAVAYHPGEEMFLVGWLSRKEGAAPLEVMAAACGPAGDLLLAPRKISGPSSPYGNSLSSPPALCHEERDGSWVLAWDDGQSIYGRRLFPDGSLETPVVLAAGGGAAGARHEHPALAYGRLDREVFMVSRQVQAGRLEGRRFPPDLGPLLSKKLIAPSQPGPPSAAYAEARNSFFIVYDRGPGLAKEIVGRELAEGDKLSSETVLAAFPGVAPQAAYSAGLDDLVALFIDGRFDVSQVDAFGQLGRATVAGINVSRLPSHRVVNGLRAVRVDRGKAGTAALWYDNLYAADQRARFRLLYDDGTLSPRRLVVAGDALEPAGAFSAQHRVLFTAYTRPVAGGYHVYGKAISLED